MEFDEEEFYPILQELDCTAKKISFTTKYIINYINDNKLICKLIYHFYTTTKSEISKLAIFYLINQVIVETYLLKYDKFIINFSRNLPEYIDDLSELFSQDNETLKQIKKIINQWENNMIYTRNFCEKLRKITDKKIEEKENKLNDTTTKNAVSLLKDPNINKGIFLHLQSDNISRMIKEINKPKIDTCLSKDKLDSKSRYFLEKYLIKLKEIKSILIDHIILREDYINNLAEMIQNDKEKYFKFLQEEK